MGPNLFFPEFDQEMAQTRVALARIPADRFDFRPHEKSWTMGELATHIATVPLWLTMTLATDEFDLEAPVDQPPPPADPEALLDRFDQHLASARAALEAATPEALGKPWTLRSGNQVVFTLPRAAVIRGMILNHMIHHRGQLTVYLRLTGVPVPSLYGPSADEPS
jgi:uncharacterized damage-inducible protein DinB